MRNTMLNEPENLNTALSDEIQLHVRRLTDPNFFVRHNAQKALLRLSTEAINPLIKEFEKAFQKYQSRELLLRKIGKNGLAVGAVLFVALMIAVELGLSKNIARPLFGLPSTILFFSCFLLPFGSGHPARLKAIYDVLVEMHDPRIFSILLEMYSANPAWSSDNTLNLLTAYLPETTPAQWEGLNSKQRKAVYHLVENRGQIDTKRCHEFTIAALKALEQYGDADAIPAVQHIAKHGSNAGLRSAAVNCLPYLETRHDEQSTRQTLLRGSQSSGGKDELLRVPTHAPDVESEQLLRMPREGE